MMGVQRQRRHDGDGRSLSWFRHWCGLSTDPKFAGVAARTGQPVDRVVFVFVHVLEQAAYRNDGGAFDVDVQALSYLLRTGVDELESIMAGFEAAGLTRSGLVANWLKRQPPSDHDPTATARQRRKRERTKNESAASVTRDSCVTAGDETERLRSPENREHMDRNLTVSCPKPGKPVRTRNAYPEDFEQFWSAYPTDRLMSKSEAAKAWGRLTGSDRELVAASVPAFKAHCEQHPDYRPVHACRYLTQRRFEGFGNFVREQQANGKVWVKVGTPQFDAWNAWWHDNRGKSLPQSRGGWYVPSEFPPRLEVAAAVRRPRTETGTALDVVVRQIEG